MISEVHNIDCLEYMKGLPDKFFDVIITDPPYGVGLEYSQYIDTVENWYLLMDRFIPEAKRIANMVVFPSCRINSLDFFYKNHKPDWIIIWHKGSPGIASYIGFNDYEPLLVYGKNKAVSMHDHFTLCNTEKMGKYGHPCPKPVQWFRYLYSKSCKKGYKVFDPFMGSQSSRLAAYEMGFDFYGTELDKEYFEAGNRRFELFKQQASLFTPEQKETVSLGANLFPNDGVKPNRALK